MADSPIAHDPKTGQEYTLTNGQWAPKPKAAPAQPAAPKEEMLPFAEPVAHDPKTGQEFRYNSETKKWTPIGHFGETYARPLEKVLEAEYHHPLQAPLGAVEAVVSGLESMFKTSMSGLAGMDTTLMGKGFQPGYEAAAKSFKRIDELTAPESAFGQAATPVLGLPTQALHDYAGTPVFDFLNKHAPAVAPVAGAAVETLGNALLLLSPAKLKKARAEGPLTSARVDKIIKETRDELPREPTAELQREKQAKLDKIVMAKKQLDKILNPKTYMPKDARKAYKGIEVRPEDVEQMLSPKIAQQRWTREQEDLAARAAALEKEQQTEQMWRDHEAAKEAAANRVTEPYYTDPYKPNSVMTEALARAAKRQTPLEAKMRAQLRGKPGGKEAGVVVIPGRDDKVEVVTHNDRQYGMFEDKNKDWWMYAPRGENADANLPSESPWVNQYLGSAGREAALRELKDKAENRTAAARYYSQDLFANFFNGVTPWKRQRGSIDFFGTAEEPPRRMRTDLLASVRDKNRRLEPKTTVDAPGGIEAVKKSLQQYGFNPSKPATLTVSTADNMAYLTDGNTRVSAAHELGMPTVPVRIEVTDVPFTENQRIKARPINELGLSPNNLPRKVLNPQKAADREEIRRLLGDYEEVQRKVIGPKNQQGFLDLGPILRKLPGYKAFEDGLVTDIQQILRTMSPESLSEDAKKGGAVIGEGIARKARADMIADTNAKTNNLFWESKPKKARRDFIYQMEEGKPFKDPALEAMRLGYKARNEAVYAYDHSMGLTYEPVDNYLYHLWRNPKAAETFFQMRYGAKFNNPKFIKERGWNLYREGIEEGHLEPLYDNPEQIMLAREHASNLMGMRVQILRDLADYGLAIRKTKGMKQPADTVGWRAPNGEWYYVHGDVAQILHNAFDSRSLWSHPGIPGQAFRGWMFLKNRTVPIILSFSAYHPLHIALGMDFAADVLRNTKEVAAGIRSPVSFVQQLLKEPAGLVERSRGGARIVKAWKGQVPKEELTEYDAAALQAMNEGGFVPINTKEWNTKAKDSFVAAVRRHSLAAAWHLPWAALETLNYPIFEYWIPNLKAANYLADVTTALKTDPTLMEDPLRRKVEFRKLAKSVDDRFGEMNYDQLFWDRTIRDTGVASALSMGWTLGFVRQYGGAVLELPRGVMTEHAIAKGRLDKAIFVGYYTMAALTMGGLMTYAMTGTAPQGMTDLMYPRIGKNPDGSPKRVNTMFYTREFGSLANHMRKEGVLGGLSDAVVNKAAPVVPLVSQWFTNLDYMNREISDPNAPPLTQLEQKLAYTIGDLDPISFESSKRTSSTKEKALSFLGFTPAPKYVTETPLEGQIKHLAGYYNRHVTPYEKAQYSEDMSTLHRAFKEGDMQKYVSTLESMQKKYGLSGEQIARIQKNARTDPLVRMFKSLSTEQQVRLMKGMSKEELMHYFRSAHKDAQRKYYMETLK